MAGVFTVRRLPKTLVADLLEEDPCTPLQSPDSNLSQLPRAHFDTLATPKSLPAGFLEDRRSIYWENDIPVKDYTKTTSFVLTPRQAQLVYSKKLHPQYQGDRPSPIWKVSAPARSATASPHLVQLAQPKQLHPSYKPCREVMTVIPQDALRVRPTEHFRRLARHKTYPPLPIKTNSEWDWGEWRSDISHAAKTAEASSHLRTLAEPKHAHPLHQPCRQVQWPVSRAALTHVASEQVQKLAQLKPRNGELEDYNPHAWVVSRAALLSQASPRISELSTPLPRKCRTKKS